MTKDKYKNVWITHAGTNYPLEEDSIKKIMKECLILNFWIINKDLKIVEHYKWKTIPQLKKR